jgi:AmmeMemoRadiSam system protein B
MTKDVRPAAVAGAFYPGRADRLRDEVETMLGEAPVVELGVAPRILIVPHAGYVYSGPVAASAYRLLLEQPPSRIGLLGPSHYVGFHGLAAPEHDLLETPLGTVAVDAIIDKLVTAGMTTRSRSAHHREHSLEVQLPFIQVVAPEATVAPLLTGDDDPSSASQAISAMLDASMTVLISSDLSHYLDHESAMKLDAKTAASIADLRESDLGRETACGRTAVRGALLAAAARGWAVVLLDLRTSGDTAGSGDRVVGYGAFVIGPERAA